MFSIVSNKSANLEKLMLTSCVCNVSMFLWSASREASCTNSLVSLKCNVLLLWNDVDELMKQIIGKWSLTSRRHIPEGMMFMESSVPRRLNKVGVW